MQCMIAVYQLPVSWVQLWVRYYLLQEYDISEPEVAWCFASCSNPFDVDPDVVPEIEEYFTADFSRERIKM